MTHWRFRTADSWPPVVPSRLRTALVWLALTLAAWAVVIACGYVLYRAAMRVLFGGT